MSNANKSLMSLNDLAGRTNTCSSWYNSNYYSKKVKELPVIADIAEQNILGNNYHENITFLNLTGFNIAVCNRQGVRTIILDQSNTVTDKIDRNYLYIIKTIEMSPIAENAYRESYESLVNDDREILPLPSEPFDYYAVNNRSNNGLLNPTLYDNVRSFMYPNNVSRYKYRDNIIPGKMKELFDTRGKNTIRRLVTKIPTKDLNFNNQIYDNESDLVFSIRYGVDELSHPRYRSHIEHVLGKDKYNNIPVPTLHDSSIEDIYGNFKPLVIFYSAAFADENVPEHLVPEDEFNINIFQKLGDEYIRLETRLSTGLSIEHPPGHICVQVYNWETKKIKFYSCPYLNIDNDPNHHKRLLEFFNEWNLTDNPNVPVSEMVKQNKEALKEANELLKEQSRKELLENEIELQKLKLEEAHNQLKIVKERHQQEIEIIKNKHIYNDAKKAMELKSFELLKDKYDLLKRSRQEELDFQVNRRQVLFDQELNKLKEKQEQEQAYLAEVHRRNIESLELKRELELSNYKFKLRELEQKNELLERELLKSKQEERTAKAKAKEKAVEVVERELIRRNDLKDRQRSRSSSKFKDFTTILGSALGLAGKIFI